MAHFAELDKDNRVIRIIVVDNDITHDENGVENEALGIAFCQSLFGKDTKWVQTSYNGNMHNKFAGVDDIYDPKLNAFISRSPFPSWILNEETLEWEPPITIPTPKEGFHNVWNEAQKKFDEIPNEETLAIE